MAINKTINKRTNSHGAMRNCIEYVLWEGKTDQHLVHITGPHFWRKSDCGERIREGCMPIM